MISFNSYNLSSAYLIVNNLNKSDSPIRDIQSESLSFQDGFNVLSSFWRERRIVIGGTIEADSATHLGTLLDELKLNLSGLNKNLDVDYGGSTRRYKATLTKFEAPEDFFNINHIPYSCEFTCQPFGYDTTITNFSSDDVTSSSKNLTTTIAGTYKPLPIISISFDTALGVTGLTFTNNTNGDVISITKAISAGGLLRIDTEKNIVTYNGVQIDFSGPMPMFEVGSNSLTIAVTSTSHRYDLDIDYTARYL
jgi:hypothetical protein